jgi:hypothetical protein
MASLCGSPRLSADEGYLQYRFGQANKVELTFPRQRTASLKQFRYAHYFRYQVDRTEISFEREGYTYTLFDSYEGDRKPQQRRRGVLIEAPGKSKKPVTLPCGGAAQSTLQTLESVVPCDKESPLNMGNCL